MNEYVEQFDQLTTEHLLEKRALGREGLTPAAYQAIEEVLTKRGVGPEQMHKRAQPGEKRAAGPQALGKKSGKGKLYLTVAVSLFAGTAAQFLAKPLAPVAWIFIIAAGIWAIAWARRQKAIADETPEETADRIVQRDGLTELMQASAEGDLKRVEELLASGAQVNEKSFSGATALMFAAKSGHLEVVRKLIESGADITMQTRQGRTAIEFAQHAGRAEIVVLLEASHT